MATARPVRLAVFCCLAALSAAACADDLAGSSAPQTPTGPSITDPTQTPGPAPIVDPASGLPMLTEVMPALGATRGLDEVQLLGANLSDVVSVRFGAAEANDAFVVHDGLIVVLTPPQQAGLVDVTVITVEGLSATLPLGFNYRDEVQITLVEPAIGDVAGGEEITVYGTGFGADATVLIGGRAAPIVEVSDSETLTAITPSGTAGTATLYVSSSEGIGRYAPGFVYVAAPRIDLVSPALGARSGGYRVDVMGAGLSEVTGVRFGAGALGDLQVHGEDHLSGVVPPAGDLALVDVSALSPRGVATAVGAFLYEDAEDRLALHSVRPREGAVGGGDRVTLLVAGLTSTTPEVRFGILPATVLSVDPASRLVVVETPATQGAGVVSVSVDQDGATSAIAEAFAYVDRHTIAGVSPGGGPAAGGTTFTVTGAGLAQGATVMVGALPATDVRVQSAESLTAVSPAGTAGPADVRVIQGGITATLEDAFTYAGEPALWVVAPPSGAIAGGTEVTLLGSGFPTGGQVSVAFGGRAATDITVVDAQTIRATTPAGDVGQVAVSVTGEGRQVTHQRGFTYFDPASQPGTWGGPVEGSLNVTVIDARSGAPIASAAVLVGRTASSPHRGFTNPRGQVTFSGELAGQQIATASKQGYQTAQVAGFNARNVTLAIEPVPTCEDIADIPCDQIVDPPPSADFEGTIVGSVKAPVTPWGACADWPDADGGACTPCEDGAMCGDDQACTVLPGQKPACLTRCDTDEACSNGFVCFDPTGEDKDRLCLPPAGEARTYCDVTQDSMWDDDLIGYPGVAVNDEGIVQLPTRLGNFAVYCWHGAYIRGVFRPTVMGITRGLSAFEGGAFVAADIRLDIPISKEITVEVDRPSMGPPSEELTTLRTILSLGGDGVVEFPPLRGEQGRHFQTTLPALTGDIYDGSWTFFVNVEVSSINGYSAALEEGIRDIDNAVDLAWVDGEWKLQPGVPNTTRAIAGTGDGVLVVGEGGRIGRSFALGHWAEQFSGTDQTLHGVSVGPDGGAIAVGAAGVATHYNGLIWEVQPTPVLTTLESVWMGAGGKAWAVGGTRVLRWNGTAWRTHFEAPHALHAVWGDADGKPWIVGDGGYVARWRDGAWQQVDTPLAFDLFALTGSAEAGLIAVGEWGAVLRYDADTGSFVREESGTERDLLAAWTRADGTVVAVGRRGVVLRFDGAVWSDESHPDYRGTLYAVGGDGETLWALGARELVLGPMLGIAQNVRPEENGFLQDRISWSVSEDVGPDYQAVLWDGAAGPCIICDVPLVIPYTEWSASLRGDATEAWFPSMGSLPNGGAITPGFKPITIARVLLNTPFDFDATASNGLSTAYRAWSVRGVSYLVF